MKKIVRNITLAAFALSAMAACKESVPNTGTDEPIYQLGVTTTVTEQSTATDLASSKVTINQSDKTTAFSSTDKIGIYLVEWNMANTAATTLEAIGNQTDNHLYTYDGTNWSAGKLTNPLTYRKVSAYAYHPHVASVTSALSLPFTVKTNQSAGIASTDYLMHGVGTTNTVGYNPSKGDKIGLKFSHKLTRLVIKVALPTSYAGQIITAIDAVSSVACPVGGSLDISTGNFTASSTLGEVKMWRSDDKAKPLEGVFEAMVVPSTITQFTKVVRIDYTTSTSTKGSLYYYAAQGGLKLDPSQIHTLTLKTTELGFVTELPTFNATPININDVMVVCSTGKEWTVTSNNTDWIQVSLSSSFSNSIKATNTGQLVAIQTLPNTTGAPRIGSVTLSSEGFTDREITILQKAD